MKYKDIISFEPITEVVKFSRTTDREYQEALIKSFVFSDTFKDYLVPLMVSNLDFNGSNEIFGLQVVGNYGTGKSHLMSLISLIAEDETLLNLVSDDGVKSKIQPIAGKFKVLRFELGNRESLWDVITFQLTNYLKSVGVDFSFDGHGPKSYFEKLMLMMAEFEEKHPDKGLLLVIDEMLAYLKSRSTPDKLNDDLAVLQALGQACDRSKFKFVFGVQEMIYHASEFQFASEMLRKVKDRYKDIKITKDDVAFIVKNRLLRKDEHQKQMVKDHLDPFLKLFTDMHARTQDYIELFPVHPTYFENFEKIKIAKSQREILKTLSGQFEEILEMEIPKDNPGLLTYDRYWEDMQKDQSLMSEPDIRKVKEITDTVSDKIDTYFTGARASKIEVAKRITNACAIKVLQQELQKQNGTNAEHLVDDLCLTDKLASDRDFLIDVIDTAAQQIITATSGQYFDKNTENAEYHLRIEGGINFDQKIKDYAATMADGQKDEYFFKFLEINLPLDYDTYRTGFRIWEHTVEWKSHKTYREGYIFFGNPNEKSTTHPRQHFYMYFMPIFDAQKKLRNHEEDEVYFIFDNLSAEFKNAVTLYGAALSLEVRADSSQKPIYRQKIDELNKKARDLFNQEYVQITSVDYMGKELPLSGYPLPGAGASKEQVFSEVASLVFEEWFDNERPDYPKFTQLNTPVTKDNYIRLVKQALVKIANPELSNRDGEGILSGLGLWVPGMLNYDHSPYAQSLLQMLRAKGDGMVLNKDEMMEFVERSNNLLLTKDYHIEAELQFVVMSALAALGEIEITLNSGKSINSTNLSDLKDLLPQDFYSFTHIKQPKGLNLAALKLLFTILLGRDLSAHLKDHSTYTALVGSATDWAKRTVSLLSKIQGGYMFKGIEIISPLQASDYRIQFTAFSGLCDKLAGYTSEAKIKNFAYTVEDLNRLLPVKTTVESLENQLAELGLLNEDLSYLQQARQYVTDPEFKAKIDNTVAQLPAVVESGSKKEMEKFRSELSKLRNEYAEWYLSLYLKYRISERDDTQKQALLNSEDLAVCTILKDADFLSAGQYYAWNTSMHQLKVADTKVNKAAVLAVPYQDFNPLEYTGGQVISVESMKHQLSEILTQWTDVLLETMEDPMVKRKFSLLDQDDRELLADFQSGKTKLSKDNALQIRNAVMDLHKGLEKVELDFEAIKNTFNRPLTPDDAVQVFKEYIDVITKGKEREKIRIILK